MESFDYSNIKPLYWTKDTGIGKVIITTEPTPLRVESENLPKCFCRASFYYFT